MERGDVCEGQSEGEHDVYERQSGYEEKPVFDLELNEPVYEDEEAASGRLPKSSYMQCQLRISNLHGPQDRSACEEKLGCEEYEKQSVCAGPPTQRDQGHGLMYRGPDYQVVTPIENAIVYKASRGFNNSI